MLTARAALRQQCEVLHRMVLNTARANTVCRRLLSVPGVGPIVALTYATGVDDPARFTHAQDLGPHFGLTPRKYASGEIDRNGVEPRGPIGGPPNGRDRRSRPFRAARTNCDFLRTADRKVHLRWFEFDAFAT